MKLKVALTKGHIEIIALSEGREGPTLRSEMAVAALCFAAGWYWPVSVNPEYFAPAVWIGCVAVLLHHSLVLGRRLVSTHSTCAYGMAVCLLFQLEAALIVTLLGLPETLSLRTQLWALGVVSAGIGLFRHRIVTPPLERRVRIGTSISGAGLVVIAFAWLVTTVNQVRYTVIESDSMWYHLPMVAEWIRSGSIWPADTIPVLARAYPGFRESVLTFLSLPLHSEHLALLGILELPLLALSVFALATFFCSNQALAISAASYAVSAPMVAAALTTQKNDLSLGILFCVSLYFVLHAMRKPVTEYAILGGGALGALAAAKFSGIIYAGAILLVSVLWKWWHASRNATAQTRHWVIMLSAAMLAGGLWYSRNIIAFSNPLYPAELRVGRWVLFEGPMDRAAFASQTLGWNLRPLAANSSHFIEAFGILIPLIIAAVVGFGVLSWFAQSSLRQARVPFVLSLICFVAFLQQPFNLPNFGFAYNMRYLLPWFFASLVALAAVFSRQERMSNWVAALLLAGSIGNLALWTHWWWMAAAIILILFAGSWTFFRREWILEIPQRLVRAIPWGALCVFSIAAVQIQSAKAGYQYHRDYGYKDSPGDRGWGDISAYVHRELREKRIVVHGAIQMFPLYGDRLSNRLFLADHIGTAEALVAFAREKKADYIVTFVPIAGRQGASDFTYGESLGAEVIKQFPKVAWVARESLGSYLLELRK